jgi:CspA family cold shock protein
MTTGTVKFFNDSKGYGFIAPDEGGNDAFVHISAVERSGMRTLRENQRVSYELQEDRRGKMAAVNLKAADDVGAEQPADESAAEEQPTGEAAGDQATGEADEAQQGE